MKVERVKEAARSLEGKSQREAGVLHGDDKATGCYSKASPTKLRESHNCLSSCHSNSPKAKRITT